MLSPASADRLEPNRIDAAGLLQAEVRSEAAGSGHCAQDFAAGPTKGQHEIPVDSVIRSQ